MLTLKNQILLNHSADDWDLYTINHARECDRAADEINRAIMEAVNAGMTEDEVVSAVMPVFERYSDLGACDSESLGTLNRILEKIFTGSGR
jgi:hypothetical protein